MIDLSDSESGSAVHDAGSETDIEDTDSEEDLPGLSNPAKVQLSPGSKSFTSTSTSSTSSSSSSSSSSFKRRPRKVLSDSDSESGENDDAAAVERLKAIYRRVAPEKLPKVTQIWALYRTRTADLASELERKYPSLDKQSLSWLRPQTASSGPSTASQQPSPKEPTGERPKAEEAKSEEAENEETKSTETKKSEETKREETKSAVTKSEEAKVIETTTERQGEANAQGSGRSSAPHNDETSSQLSHHSHEESYHAHTGGSPSSSTSSLTLSDHEAVHKTPLASPPPLPITSEDTPVNHEEAVASSEEEKESAFEQDQRKTPYEAPPSETLKQPSEPPPREAQ
eukprot:Sspe_Gene.110945::Locus_92087_Transcript_1_1_Confidence_1.000_Length_1084::g.110945::m.110945